MGCLSTNRIVFVLITLWVASSLSTSTGPPPQDSTDSVSTNSVEESTTQTESPSNKETPSDDKLKDTTQKHGKKKRCRRRQKTFIRNPNYIIPNKCYEKESKRASMRKWYSHFPLPHPGAVGKSSKVHRKKQKRVKKRKESDLDKDANHNDM